MPLRGWALSGFRVISIKLSKRQAVQSAGALVEFQRDRTANISQLFMGKAVRR